MAGLDQLIQIIRENRRAEREDKRLDYALASENLRLMYQRDMEKDKMDFQKTTMLWQAAKNERDIAQQDYEAKVSDYEDTYGAHMSLDELNITEGYQKFIDGTFNEEITMDQQEIKDMTDQANAYKSVASKIDTVMKTKLAPVNKLFSGDYGFHKGDPSRFDAADLDINFILDQGKKSYSFLNALTAANNELEGGSYSDRILRNNNPAALMYGPFAESYGAVSEDDNPWYDIIDSNGAKIGEAFSEEDAKKAAKDANGKVQGPYYTAKFATMEDGERAQKDFLLKQINDANGDVDAFLQANPKYEPYRDAFIQATETSDAFNDPIIQQYYDSRYQQIDKVLYDLEADRLAKEAETLENISKIRDLKLKAKYKNFVETEAEIDYVSKAFAFTVDSQVDQLDMLFDNVYSLDMHLDLWETMSQPGYKGGMVYSMATENGMKYIGPDDSAIEWSESSQAQGTDSEGDGLVVTTTHKGGVYTQYNMDDPMEKQTWYEQHIDQAYYNIGLAINPLIGKKGKEGRADAIQLGKKWVTSVSEFRKTFDISRTKGDYTLLEADKIFNVYDDAYQYIAGDNGLLEQIMMSRANRDARSQYNFETNPDSKNYGRADYKYDPDNTPEKLKQFLLGEHKTLVDGQTYKVPGYYHPGFAVNAYTMRQNKAKSIKAVSETVYDSYEFYQKFLGQDPFDWVTSNEYTQFDELRNLYDDLKLNMGLDILDRNLGNIQDWSEPGDIDGDGFVSDQEIDYFDYLQDQKKKDNSVIPSKKDDTKVDATQTSSVQGQSDVDKTSFDIPTFDNQGNVQNAYAYYREMDWDPTGEAWYDESVGKEYGWSDNGWNKTDKVKKGDLYASLDPGISTKKGGVLNEIPNLAHNRSYFNKSVEEGFEETGLSGAYFNRGLPWHQTDGVAGGGDRNLGLHTNRGDVQIGAGYLHNFIADEGYHYYFSGDSKTTNSKAYDPENPNADTDGYVHYFDPFMETGNVLYGNRYGFREGIPFNQEIADLGLEEDVYTLGEEITNPNSVKKLDGSPTFVSHPHPYYTTKQFALPNFLLSPKEGGPGGVFGPRDLPRYTDHKDFDKPIVSFGFYPSDNKYADLIYSLDDQELETVAKIYNSMAGGDSYTYTYDGELNTVDHFNDWYNHHAPIVSSLSDSQFGVADDRILHLPHLPELVLFRKVDVPYGLHHYIEQNPDMAFVEERFVGMDSAKGDTPVRHRRSGARGLDEYAEGKITEEGEDYFRNIEADLSHHGIFKQPKSDFIDPRYRNVNWTSESRSTLHGNFYGEDTEQAKKHIARIKELYPEYDHEALKNIRDRVFNYYAPAMNIIPPDKLLKLMEYYEKQIGHIGTFEMPPLIEFLGSANTYDDLKNELDYQSRIENELNNYIDRLA